MSQPVAPTKVHSVVIAPYDPQWPERAAAEGRRLAQVLGDILFKVEHIGSTSVPGLAAKPIIDLIPLVRSLDELDQYAIRVESLGFAWHGEFGIEGRRFCTLTDSAGTRLVNLHCFQTDSPEVERHLVFRDYIRSHPSVARDYETEKRRAAALHPNDSRAYNDEKWQWVAKTEAEAMKWHAGRS
jgi:GrpB-like predicted nucleotidyltransferase (UPF0157 family)